MRVQHNITAMNSYRNFKTNNSSLSKNLEKLSSGYAINRAGDNAAGLAISEKMRAQITGLDVAQKNANDGISLVQTAEGALTEVHSMLNRMYELAEQSANGTYESSVDRAQLQKEVVALKDEINRIADSANFNGINLLNGDLAASEAVEDSISISETGSVNFGDGITMTQTDGEGAKSTFELSIDSAFGEGDTLTLSFDIPQDDGSTATKSLTLTYSGSAITNNDTNLTFTGVTVEEQLASIKDRLTNGTSTALDTADTPTKTLAQFFAADDSKDFKVAGTDKLTFTANAEAATDKLHLADVEVNNVDAGVAGITVTTAATASTGGTLSANGVTGLVTGNKHYVAGDKLQFEFNLADDKTATATVELTAEMLQSDDTATITSNIVEALKQTSFDDNKATAGFDESQFKVSDFFDVSANTTPAGAAGTGSVKIVAKDDKMPATASWFKLNDVKLAQNGSASFSSIHGASGTVVAATNATAAATAGTAGKKTVEISQNLAEGDTFTLEGKLADGRAFSVELTAGKTANASKNIFAVGAAETNTTQSIAAVLNGNSKITVTNADGSTTELKGSDVFNDTSGTFKAIVGTTDLVIENRQGGLYNVKGLTGDITYAGIDATEAAASGEQTQAGVDATKATLELSFDKDAIEYGTAVTIGSGANAKTFELVAAAGNKTETDNIEVVIADLDSASSDDVAAAFKDAIDNQLKDATTAANYSAWAGALGVGTAGNAHGGSLSTIDGSTIKLTNNLTTGSTSKAAAAEMTYGEVSNVTLGYETNDDGSLKLEQGDTIVINDVTYQFDTTTRNLQDDNKLIKVDDFTDKSKIAAAIQQAVNEDFEGKLSAKINSDNTVTISGVFDSTTKTYTTPDVQQATVSAGGGLTLQIGDTSDSFNQMKVEVNDMHTSSLGIKDDDGKLTSTLKDIDISTQEGAAAACDILKAAINQVSDVRGGLGAIQNRLEHTINNLGVMQENLQNAESVIRDTDVADEMMQYTKNSILNQSAQAMLAQANQLPQGVLQLLQ